MGVFSVTGNKHGTCRLCETETMLRKSHIIPEFCYSYEQTGNARHAIAARISVDGSEQGTVQRIQKGYRERLLCGECEQKLGKYEKRFADLWREKVLSQDNLAYGQTVALTGVDHIAVKMMVLSVLWRANCSELFGSAVDLGPYHDKLRALFLGDAHISQGQYPMLCRLIVDREGMLFHGCVTQPYDGCVGASRVYFMCFAGGAWQVVLSDKWIEPELKFYAQALTDQGEMYLPVVHFRQVRELREMAPRLPPAPI